MRKVIAKFACKFARHERKFTLFIAIRDQRASLLTYLSAKQTNII